MSSHAGSEVTGGRPLTDAIVEFGRFVRDEGFNVGMRETLDAVRTTQLGILPRRDLLKASLRSLFCTSRAEWMRFDQLFDEFWIDAGAGKGQRGRKRQVDPRGKSTRVLPKNPLAGIGGSVDEVDDEPGSRSAGASELERLRKTDFSQVSEDDRHELEQLVLSLALRMRVRLSRRQEPSARKGRVDLRRTIRRSISYGGDPVDLRYRGPKTRKPRLVALLDISGSMDQYSFFLLRFVYSLQQHFDRVEAFVFSTRLVCVTDALRARRFGEALPRLAEEADAWSSGTRIGSCLADFNSDFAGRVVDGDTLVFVLSDGLDTGDPGVLSRELAVIRNRARKLIWLNPLLGMDGYEPAARGMTAALPLVDAFVPAHNLDSLQALESELRHV